MKNLLLYALFLPIPLTGQSQSTDPIELPSPVPYFNSIIVQDLDVSIEWYSDILGFEVRNQLGSEERGYRIANLELDKTLVELIELENSVESKDLLQDMPEGTRIQGLFKFGFSVSEFDDWVTALTKSGVRFHGSVVRDSESGKRMVIILDPDGNRIQFFEQ